MKYYTRVSGNEYEIAIEGDQVFIDGEIIDVDLKQSGATELYSMLFNGTSYEMLIESDRFNYTVMLRGEQFQVQVEDERMRRLNAGRKAPALDGGELVVSAPIPGLVVKVLVEEGDEVTENQPLLILEAMKMENEIRAQRNGRIKTVDAVAGARVEQNAVLIVLE